MEINRFVLFGWFIKGCTFNSENLVLELRSGDKTRIQRDVRVHTSIYVYSSLTDFGPSTSAVSRSQTLKCHPYPLTSKITCPGRVRQSSNISPVGPETRKRLCGCLPTSNLVVLLSHCLLSPQSSVITVDGSQKTMTLDTLVTLRHL